MTIAARRRRRPRQHALQVVRAPGAAAGRARPAGRGGRASSCTSSCSPTSGSSGCRTPASRRCSRGSRARSRRSPAYPFTTLEPVLGTLEADDRQLVVADIPGLIEGASDGAGLGHDFLAHVERTRLLVHVLDLAPLDGSDPSANHAVIERELAEHDPRLAALPRMLALSKADLVVARARRRRPPRRGASGWARRCRCSSPRAPRARVSTSSRASCCGAFRPRSRSRTRRRARTRSPSQGVPPGGGARTSRSSAIGDGGFRVIGDAVDRLIARHDMENDEALALVEHRLRRMGVIAALRGARVRTRRRRRARRDRVRARSGLSALGFAPAMPVLVVKLGSSVVAQDSGELRLSVVARVCEEVASAAPLRRRRRRRHLGGDRARHAPARAARPPDGDRRAAGGERGRPGAAVPHLRRPAARAGAPDGAGPAHVLRHERAHALPQRAPHAADAARLARGAGDQRERHDDHGRDLLRRQRLPRRAGRRAGGRASCSCS